METQEMAKSQEVNSKSAWLVKFVGFILGLFVLNYAVGFIDFTYLFTGGISGLLGAIVAQRLKLFEFSPEGTLFTSRSDGS